MTILIVLSILISTRLSYVYFLLDVLLFCNNTFYRLNHPVKIMKTAVIFTIIILEMSLALDIMGPCGRKVQTDTSMDFHKVILICFENFSFLANFRPFIDILVHSVITTGNSLIDFSCLIQFYHNQVYNITNYVSIYYNCLYTICFH